MGINYEDPLPHTVTYTTSVQLTYSERNWKCLILLNEESVSNSQGHICAAKISSIYSPPTTRSQTHSFLPPDSFLLSCHPTPPPHLHFFVLVPPGVVTISAETFLSPPLPCNHVRLSVHVLSTVSIESLSDNLGIRKACFCLLKLLIFICGFFTKVRCQFLAYKKQCRNSQKQTLRTRKPRLE